MTGCAAISWFNLEPGSKWTLCLAISITTKNGMMTSFKGTKNFNRETPKLEAISNLKTINSSLNGLSELLNGF